MNSAAPMISHMSIFILSYFLVHTAVSGRMPPALAIDFVLAGTIGFIAYVMFEWSATQQAADRAASRR